MAFNISFKNTEQRSLPKPASNYDLDYHLSGQKLGNYDLTLNQKIGVVYTCQKILSENFSKLPVSIYKTVNNGRVEDRQHKLFTTFLKPASYLNQQTWISTLTNHLYSTGNAFAYIKKNADGSIELPIIKAGYITDARILEDGKLWYYSLSDGKAWRAEDLLHFKLMSYDGFIGVNPIEAQALSINLNYKAETTVDKYYSNNAQTSKYMEYNGANIDKIKEAVADFEKENSGIMNAGKIPILPPNATLKTLPLSIEDAKFLDTAIYSEKSIASMFGVPVHFLGHADNKYSNFEQSALNFKNNTMAALINIFETEMEFKLLSLEERIEGVNIYFDLERLIETSLIEKANFYKILKDASFISLNEGAKKLGFAGTENEYGDYHYTQLQYIPVEMYEKYANKVPVNITNVESTGSAESNKEE